MKRVKIKKLLSVVIITKDRPLELIKNIDNIRKQDFDKEAYEIIVYDNGSSVENFNKIKRYINKIKLANLIFLRTDSNNATVVTGRNEAISYATGKYILQLDDDAYLTQKIGLQQVVNSVKELERKKIDFGVLTGKLKNIHYDETPKYFYKTKIDDTYYLVTHFAGFGAVINKEKFEKVGGYDSRFGSYSEEGDLSLMFMQRNWPIIFNPRIEIVHNVSKKRFFDDKVKATLFSRNILLSMYKNYPLVYFAILAPMSIMIQTINNMKNSFAILKGIYQFLTIRHKTRNPLQYRQINKILKMKYF